MDLTFEESLALYDLQMAMLSWHNKKSYGPKLLGPGTTTQIVAISLVWVTSYRGEDDPTFGEDQVFTRFENLSDRDKHDWIRDCIREHAYNLESTTEPEGQ